MIKNESFLLVGLLMSFWCGVLSKVVEIEGPFGYPSLRFDTQNLDVIAQETFDDLILQSLRESRPFRIAVVFPVGTDPQIYEETGLARALVRAKTFKDPLTNRPINQIFIFDRTPQGTFELVPYSQMANLLHALRNNVPENRWSDMPQADFIFHNGHWIDVSKRQVVQNGRQIEINSDNGIEYYDFINLCAAWQRINEEQRAEGAGHLPRSGRFGVCDPHADYYSEIGRMTWWTEEELTDLKRAYEKALGWVEPLWRQDVTQARAAGAERAREELASQRLRQAGPADEPLTPEAEHLNQETSRLFTALSDENYDEAIAILQKLYSQARNGGVKAFLDEILTGSPELIRRWG